MSEVTNEKRPVGRPRKEIDWVEFDKLCAMQCTLGEIAGWFECSEDTIERRVKEQFGMDFADVFKEKRSKGKIALRRQQYQTALEGNVPLLIFLGKNYLGQSDKQEMDHVISAIQIDVDDSAL